MRSVYSKYILLFLFSYLCCSCDKIDDLGGLEGQWQLTEWLSNDGTLNATQDTQIYYRFQLGLVDFHKVSLPDGFDHACFKNTEGYIHIFDHHEYVGDGHSRILPMEELAKYGVPQNGLMKIEELTSGSLVISSPESGKLSFRKY